MSRLDWVRVRFKLTGLLPELKSLWAHGLRVSVSCQLLPSVCWLEESHRRASSQQKGVTQRCAYQEAGISGDLSEATLSATCHHNGDWGSVRVPDRLL